MSKEDQLEIIFGKNEDNETREDALEYYLRDLSLEEQMKFATRLYDVIEQVRDGSFGNSGIDSLLQKQYSKYYETLKDVKEIITFNPSNITKIWFDDVIITFTFETSYCGCCGPDIDDLTFPMKFANDIEGYCEDKLQQIEDEKTRKFEEEREAEKQRRKDQEARDIATLKKLQGQYGDRLNNE